MTTSDIKPQFRFKGGDVLFRTIFSVKEKKDVWYVRQFASEGFLLKGGKIIEMSATRIIELVEQQAGNNAERCMSTTGTRHGDRFRRKATGGKRYALRWGGANRVRLASIPC